MRTSLYILAGIPTLILLFCLPTTSQAEKTDCHEAMQWTWSMQQDLTARGMDIANRIMSELSNDLFNLDCINNISLSGGIRVYGSNDLLAFLKQESCARINQWVAKANARIAHDFAVANGRLGAQFAAAIHPQNRPTEGAVENPQWVVDLNGDPQAAGAQSNEINDPELEQALRALFR